MNAGPILERIRGTRIKAGAHRTLVIDDPERVHYVERGHLDIFAVEFDLREATGRRRFVARVPVGEIAFGALRIRDPNRPEGAFGFLAVPSRDAVIIVGRRSGIAAERFDHAARTWIDQWVKRVSEFFVRDRPPPRDARLLEAVSMVPHPKGSVLCAQHSDVIWVKADAPMRFAGRPDLVVETGAPLVPLTEQTWLELDRNASVSGCYTPGALAAQQLWPGLERLAHYLLRFAASADSIEAKDTDARRVAAHRARQASVEGAMRGLVDVLDAGRGPRSRDAASKVPLRDAVALVAAASGARVEVLRGAEPALNPTDAIPAIARRGGLRVRNIRLADGWWRRDGPSFVGFSADGDGQEKPLAILASGTGRYRIVDPESGTTSRATRRSAEQVASHGVVFYPPLPEGATVGANLLRFTMGGLWRDLRVLLGAGILGGLVALLTPILTGELLVEIIPRRDIPLWMAALVALFLAAFGAAVFDIVRSLALLRIESRVDERLQSAIWSRLLALPTPFFRNFTAGDLAHRASGFGTLRQTLSGATVQAAIGGIFSVFSLLLVFYYDWFLALCVLGMLAVLTGVIWLLSRRQLRHDRETFRVEGEINGFVFQMIGGLAKLRVAHAESHALARWAERFARQKASNLAALRQAAGVHAVAGMFQPIVLAVIFAFVYFVAGRAAGPEFGLADLLVVITAFGQLTAAVIGLSGAAAAVVGVLPLIERVQPILDARPESTGGEIDPGDLKGDIEFANVSFRYGPDSPNAVDRVTIRIRQGDYVAIVGPSGCGKSTLFRLLLGFEKPDSGMALIDSHDVASLDPVALRERMGVVLQQADVVAGSLFDNIAGMSPATEQEAWEAARDAGLDEDILAMPMGMGTVIPQGGAGLSVGQRQRLLIAHALARKPRILLLDEATTALDNRTQAVLQESLKRLAITRLVIAHRLSTIRDVDRIYVMDRGRIVEMGRYDELMKRGGVFADLCRRQLVPA